MLIVGIGTGTKSLPRYLTGCRKTYETVLCFGAATDSFDVRGRVTARDREGAARVTRQRVEAALGRFRGRIGQRPPAFSARRVNGERLYDIARREGAEEVPLEMLQEREVDVFALEALEYWEGGERTWEIVPDDRADDKGSKRKRKRTPEGVKGAVGSPEKVRKMQADEAEAGLSAEGPYMSGALPIGEGKADVKAEEASECGDAPSLTADGDELLLRGPAVRLRMTVSSGFYVRSLCHDLAKELGTLGVMAELVRTTQAEFKLGNNVLEYDDLERGEDAWGPRLKELLQEWQQRVSRSSSPSSST